VLYRWLWSNNLKEKFFIKKKIFEEKIKPDIVLFVRLKSSIEAVGRVDGSTIVTCLIVVVVLSFCISCSISRSSSLDRDSKINQFIQETRRVYGLPLTTLLSD
jgi:hypothetical protein